MSVTQTVAPPIEDLDRDHVLHPFTSIAEHQQSGPHFIVGAKGTRVYDKAGREYLDTMAGLWCVNVGYGHPRMVEAIRAQTEKLCYYHSFMGLANEPAAQLADELAQRAPAGLNKVFFCNSGSEANDTNIKFVWLYNNLRGKPAKKKIIARHGAFHGTTGIAASLCGLPHMHAHFDLPFERFIHVGRPHFYFDGRPGETEREFSARLARELDERIQQEDPETVAAFIAEPVMGAAGVVPPPDGYFEAIQMVLRKHDVLFIADEVICAFGRLGAMFASDMFGLEPEIVTLAKGLTSGYIPMSASLLSDRVWDVLKTAPTMLAHGHTYTGHPIAAAAALTSLSIIEDEGLLDNAQTVGAYLQKRLRETCTAHPLIGDIRGIGMIASAELVADKLKRTPFDPKLAVARKVYNRLLEYNVIARPIQNAIAMAPPLVLTKSEVDFAMEQLKKALDRTATDLRADGIWKG